MDPALFREDMDPPPFRADAGIQFWQLSDLQTTDSTWSQKCHCLMTAIEVSKLKTEKLHFNKNVLPSSSIKINYPKYQQDESKNKS